eukprot:TRINITY_DN3545_c0_g1_i1.p1 TRINITY_DN3545_c0_g1~~TRINITY_DN3545_c0_g1_i1.p1  ORF type:complete len:239 (-),score=56.86 TRINITY_DN3545_c0_g1_i1:64-780(-)
MGTEDKIDFTQFDDHIYSEEIKMLEQSLKELEEAKENKMNSLINDMKENILELYQDLYREAEPFPSETDSLDDYLNELKSIRDTLQIEKEKAEPIFKTIIVRKKILKDRIELEKLKKDPNRLFGKSSVSLLEFPTNFIYLISRQERKENAIKTRLPKVEEKLFHLLKDWKQEQGTPLLYKGEDIKRPRRSVSKENLQQGKPVNRSVINKTKRRPRTEVKNSTTRLRARTPNEQTNGRV